MILCKIWFQFHHINRIFLKKHKGKQNWQQNLGIKGVIEIKKWEAIQNHVIYVVSLFLSNSEVLFEKIEEYMYTYHRGELSIF